MAVQQYEFDCNVMNLSFQKVGRSRMIAKTEDVTIKQQQL